MPYKALNNFIWGSKFAGVIEGLIDMNSPSKPRTCHIPCTSLVQGHPIRTSQVVCSSSQLYKSKCIYHFGGISLKSNTCRFSSIALRTKVAKVELTLYRKARWLQANSIQFSLEVVQYSCPGLATCLSSLTFRLDNADSEQFQPC